MQIILLLVFMFSGGCSREKVKQSSNSPAPGGKEMVIYVDNRYTTASEEGSGSRNAPVGSISRALESGMRSGGAKPVRIVVQPGVYRESVKIGGAGNPDRQISIVASEPGKTVISGSDIWTGWQEENRPGLYSHRWNYRWDFAPLNEGVDKVKDQIGRASCRERVCHRV